MTRSYYELPQTLNIMDSSEKETQYILNNPNLMAQIHQAKSKINRQNLSIKTLPNILDVEYILSHPDLIDQIRLLVNSYQTKNI